MINNGTAAFPLAGQPPQNLVLVIITLLQLEGFTIGLVSYPHCILPNLRNQCSGITFLPSKEQTLVCLLSSLMRRAS